MLATQPTQMYQMKPVYHANAVQDLPTSMYKMENICATNTLTTGTTLENGAMPCSEEVKALMARQEAIISRLEGLKLRVESMSASASSQASTTQSTDKSNRTRDVQLPKDLVIYCNPSVPARAVLHLVERLQADYNVLCTFYTHSSITSTPCLDLRRSGFKTNLQGVSRYDKQMVLTWIWKDCDECEMMVSPINQTKIVNESNICRYMIRLLGEYPADPVSATVLDQALDMAASLNSSEKSNTLVQLVKHLSKSPYIAGNSVGIEDIVICSAFVRLVTTGKWSNDAKLKNWSASVQQHFK